MKILKNVYDKSVLLYYNNDVGELQELQSNKIISGYQNIILYWYNIHCFNIIEYEIAGDIYKQNISWI